MSRSCPARARVPRPLLALLAGGLLAVAAGSASAALLTAVEFYNATLDHYFVTASADEIGKLDTGVLKGWSRTGQSFSVADPATVAAGMNPVCRFYGLPAAGLDSHFYSASTAECDAVKQRFAGAWELESDDVFKVGLPDAQTGKCAAGTVPVYRSWNGRTDSNHRYTTSLAIQQQMIAKGYVPEGYGAGDAAVAMCSPASDPAVRPACSLTSSSGAAIIGSSVTLTATCNGSPTAYQWFGCTSTTSSCTATSASPGTVTYSVAATNANGAGAPIGIDVTWQSPPPPEAPPVCALTVTKQTDPPQVGDVVTLFAYCSGELTAITWTGCTSTTTVCRLRGASPTSQVVSVAGTNAGGTGPTSSAVINWSAPPVAAAGMCGAFPSALYSDVGSASTLVYSTLVTDPPAFAYNGVWAIRFTVPSTASVGAFGNLAAAEFAGQPTFREVTVSLAACDFRPTDPTGADRAARPRDRQQRDAAVRHRHDPARPAAPRRRPDVLLQRAQQHPRRRIVLHGRAGPL
jgi:hypothetical protein